MGLTAALLVSLAIALFAFMLVEVAASNLRSGVSGSARRARRYWLLAVLPILSAVLFVLFFSPSTFARYWSLGLYVLFWGLPVWFTVRGYRLGVKRDHHLVRGAYNTPVSRPSKVVVQFAIANLLIAVALAATLVAIPIFQLKLKTLTLIFGVTVVAYGAFAARYQKSDVA